MLTQEQIEQYGEMLESPYITPSAREQIKTILLTGIDLRHERQEREIKEKRERGGGSLCWGARK